MNLREFTVRRWLSIFGPTSRTQAGAKLNASQLEDRLTPAAPFPEFIDPNPAPGNRFGITVVALNTGNVVITSPFDDAGGVDAGAVYLFNGATGALISTLRGSTAGDGIGSNGVTALSTGNYTVRSPFWDNGAVANVGAVTFGNGITGVNGIVSTSNSLVGSTTDDRIGNFDIVSLTNGNYVVSNRLWDNGTGNGVDAGAVTFGNGKTGIVGAVSPTNSLVGNSKGDIRFGSVKPLANGNYVVVSPEWRNGTTIGAGAVTFGNGTTGISGAISPTNSLVGSTRDDNVGGGFQTLSNGNYVVLSSDWDNGSIEDVGAVTFGNGTTGTIGLVSSANSLVGSTKDDLIGDSVTPLTNGNYVVHSRLWTNGTVENAGAVTFGNGTVGVSGAISVANSYVGAKTLDLIDTRVTPLLFGNYVISSPSWDRGAIVDAGVVILVDGARGLGGVATIGNSLYGSTAGDRVGESVTPLDNGNFVIHSPQWDNGKLSPNAGAATFSRGGRSDSEFNVVGVFGVISSANSLIGSTAGDRVGDFVTPLTNGNYLVTSEFWDNGSVVDAGAATFGNGTTGISGIISSANSLVGTTNNDQVGFDATPLLNGNYVVYSRDWHDGVGVNVGAVTFGNGTTGTFGAVSLANSLVGSTAEDLFGDFSVELLTNGNYVVFSPDWNNGSRVDAGAATFGNGTTGTTGVISSANSLVGSSTDDRVGSTLITALANGNYVVYTPEWDNGALVDAGAVTFGNGRTGVTGPITTQNSVFGLTPNTSLQSLIDENGDFVDSKNGTFFGSFFTEGSGRVRVGSQLDGFAPGTTLPAVNLSVSANTGTEAAGTIITVTVTTSTPVTGDATLTLNVIGTSITANDFRLSNAIITIPNGQTTASVTFTVLDDSEVEPTETAILTISNPSANLALGTVTSQSIAITNPTISNLPPTISAIADQSSTGDVIGPIAFTIGDDMTPVDDLTMFDAISSNTALVPASNIVISGTGANRTVTITPIAGQFGQASITIRVGDSQLVTDETFVVTVSELVSPPPPPVLPPIVPPSTPPVVPPTTPPVVPPTTPPVVPPTTPPVVPPVVLNGPGVITATAERGSSTVNVYNADGTLRLSVNPFGDLAAPLRTATGDFNNDGIEDLVVGTGAGVASRVTVFDGKTQQQIFTFEPYESTFRGGVFVATGDQDNDGFADLVVTPDSGGGPRVRVVRFDSNGGTPFADFFGIDDPNFRGGARAALGDIDGDGQGDLIVAAGIGGGPRVAVYNGSQLGGNGGPKLVNDFFAFEQSLRNGAYVSAGDVNGDGRSDIVFGGGPGGGPRVFVIDGRSLMANGSTSLTPVANFFAGNAESRDGVRVAVKDLDGDQFADIVAGTGTRLTVFTGTAILASSQPVTTLDFTAFPKLGESVFVG
jgi:Repeat of unknown function (DUF5650)/FG-GAP-like repeat